MVRRLTLPSAQVVKAEGWAALEEKKSLGWVDFQMATKIQTKMLSHSLNFEVWILQGESGLERQIQESLGHMRSWYLQL